MSTLVLGLGSRDRGDDAVGLVVAERLAPLGLPVSVRTWEGTDLDLLDTWEGYDHVVLVDAAWSGAAPGTLRRFGPDVLAAEAPATSSHAFGLPGVLALARLLDRLPGHLEIRTIEVAATEHRAGMSPAVARAAEVLVAELAAELAQPSSVA